MKALNTFAPLEDRDHIDQRLLQHVHSDKGVYRTGAVFQIRASSVSV